MKKILIISDVHSDVSELKKILNKHNDVDVKIFAGDLQKKDFSCLKSFDYVVTGNSDYPNKYNEIEYFTIDGVNFMLTHGHLFGSFLQKIDFKKMNKFAKKNDVNIVIHGHDHIKANEKIEGILRFNPGSTSFPRDGMAGSYGIITIDKKNIVKAKHYNT